MKHFDSLGVMIDCSRNAVPNIQALKRFFDIIAKMGYNTVFLYTEATYEVENEPYFGYKRGKYSMEELQEQLQYYKAGETVPFTIEVQSNKGYVEKNIEITLGKAK